MQKTEPLQNGNYYHIYNRGINGEELFREKMNYEHFLRLYDKYIEPVADTFAWCLMGIHFHLLVRIKEEDEIVTPDRVSNPVRGNFPKPPHLYFSNLFNSYTQAYNKMYNRYSSLFERPFKRKLINDESYFRQLVIYIHNNPVHHGFCSHPVEYPWSSYLTCISHTPTKLYHNTVLEWFDSVDNFKVIHDSKVDFNGLERFLKLS
jgi:REP element-mobilizing transposase RayT